MTDFTSPQLIGNQAPPSCRSCLFEFHSNATTRTISVLVRHTNTLTTTLILNIDELRNGRRDQLLSDISQACLDAHQ